MLYAEQLDARLLVLLAAIISPRADMPIFSPSWRHAIRFSPSPHYASTAKVKAPISHAACCHIHATRHFDDFAGAIEQRTPRLLAAYMPADI